MEASVENVTTATDAAEVGNSELANGASDTDMLASCDSSGHKQGDKIRCEVDEGVKYTWTDITADFIGACSSLELGELVHDSKYVTVRCEFYYR